MASLCLGFGGDKLPPLLCKNAWSSARTKTISFNYIWRTVHVNCCATRFEQFYGLFWRRLYLSLTFDNAIGARIFKMQTLKFPWRQSMKPIKMGWLILLPWAVSKLAFIRQISAVHTLMECIYWWRRACTWISLDAAVLTCRLSFAAVCILLLNENMTWMCFVSFWIFTDMWTHAVLACPWEMLEKRMWLACMSFFKWSEPTEFLAIFKLLN